MSETSSYNNNQESQSVEFIDKGGDSNTNTYATPEILTKNSNSEDNDGQNIMEEFSQNNNQDSRNTSDKKFSEYSSSEPQRIYNSQSEDSQNQNENNQYSEIKHNNQRDNDEEYSNQSQKAYQKETKNQQINYEENKDSQQDNDSEQNELQYSSHFQQNQEEQDLNDQLMNEKEQTNDDLRQENVLLSQEPSQKQLAGNHSIDKNQDNEETKDEVSLSNEKNIIKEENQMNASYGNRSEDDYDKQKFIQKNEKENQIQYAQPELNQNIINDQEIISSQQNNQIQTNNENIQQQSQTPNSNQNKQNNNIIQAVQNNFEQNNINYEAQQNNIEKETKKYFDQSYIDKIVQEINGPIESVAQPENVDNDNINSQNQENEVSNASNQNNKAQQEEYVADGQYNAQRQYEYMIEMQKRQSEFQKQMEELNQKYKINFRKIIDVRQESLEGNYLTGLLALKMKYKFIDTKDQYGMTMLHNAVLGNEKELVIFLLNNGADVNLQDICQRTPLMMAAHGGASQKQEDNSNNQSNKKNFDEDSEELRKQLKLHSFNKIFKILIDKGACFATKDAYQFSALLYSVQNQNLLILFYLVYLGASLRDSDMNGSSIVHWNAYKGNKFLMEVFNALNLDMFTADNQGYTPLDRSILGISYNTVEYLSGLLPPENVPEADIKEDDGNYKIPSISIRHILKEAKYGHKKLSNRILKWWSDICAQYTQQGIHPATFVFFAVSGILFYSAFISIYSQRNYSGTHKNESWLSSMQFMINLVFFISTFVYMSLSVRMSNTMISYKNRNQGVYIVDNDAINRDEQMKIEEQKNIPPYMRSIMSDKVQFERVLQRMNFKHLDRLLEDAPQYIATQNQQEELNRTVVTDNTDDESRIGLTSNQQSSYQHLTFIHQIAILFENNYFTSLGDVDFKRLCGTCLKYKPEKTQHCYICKTCVPYYQFHSVLFNMCISAQNHFLYLIHLFSLWFSLLTYLMIQQIQFSNYLESWTIFKYAEIPYHMAYVIGIFHSLVYIVVLFSFFYISIYSTIEILGIFEDKTRDEILNPFDYSYNYEMITDKNRNIVKVPKVRTTGIFEYLKSTLPIVYYRTFLHLKQKK